MLWLVIKGARPLALGGHSLSSSAVKAKQKFLPFAQKNRR